MKIAFIGYGQVGGALADHLQRAGHTVTLAAAQATSQSVGRALARNPGLDVASPQDAVREADVVFLATPFQANEEALKAVSTQLAGKILVDCTNPVGKDEFDDICGKTTSAMNLSREELKALIDRCDKLRATINQLEETQKKVYLKRLSLCQDLFSYVLQSKENN